MPMDHRGLVFLSLGISCLVLPTRRVVRGILPTCGVLRVAVAFRHRGVDFEDDSSRRVIIIHDEHHIFPRVSWVPHALVSPHCNALHGVG